MNFAPAGLVPVEIARPAVDMTDAVWRLQREVARLEQYQPLTRHWFADGMYCREVFRHAGVLVVGKVHKREHFYIVCSGTVRLTTDTDTREVAGPAVLVSKPGTKRAVLALTDATCLTVHRTDLTDLDAIEAELLEADPTALYDSGNIVKGQA